MSEWNADTWPAAFGWCRMGAESNQTVDEILRAKVEDASRAAGQFWYGFRSTHITAQRLEEFLAAAGPTRYLAGGPVGRGHGRRARHDLLPLSHE